MFSPWALITLLSGPVAAYIPAVAINDTTGLDLTVGSSVQVKWANPPGIYSGGVSWQLISDDHWLDVTEGALVHFTEETAKNDTEWIWVETPWIAYICCDANVTGFSEEDDIFTMARDRGAQSVLLYSNHSETCLLNSFYINPDEFDHVLDIFAVTNRNITRLLNSQFRQTSADYFYFNYTRLRDSWGDLNTTLAGETLNHSSYLGGTIYARNKTGTKPVAGVPGTGQGEHHESGGKNKGLIAAYVLAGFFGAMICLTVFSVIRRAMKPQRRDHHSGEEQPTETPRRIGLTQAIVDTFPIIKFHKSQPVPTTPSITPLKTMPNEELTPMELSYSKPYADKSFSQLSQSTSMDSGRSTPAPVSDAQCPICLLEFEDGDEIRVLPCEGSHRFHKDCVDPWLLAVSTSCPLCRKDFNPEVADTAAHDDRSRITPRYINLIHRARRRAGSVIETGPRPREADQSGPGGY